MKEDNYLDILNSNNQDEMGKFLLSNGKKKPVSPIIFFEEERKNDINRETDKQ